MKKLLILFVLFTIGCTNIDQPRADEITSLDPKEAKEFFYRGKEAMNVLQNENVEIPELDAYYFENYREPIVEFYDINQNDVTVEFTNKNLDYYTFNIEVKNQDYFPKINIEAKLLDCIKNQLDGFDYYDYRFEVLNHSWAIVMDLRIEYKNNQHYIYAVNIREYQGSRLSIGRVHDFLFDKLN